MTAADGSQRPHGRDSSSVGAKALRRRLLAPVAAMLRRLGLRRKRPAQPPTERELLQQRLASIEAQGQTLGYLLQASVAHVDLLIHPRYRVPPLKAPRTMPAASLRVKRARHYHPGPVTSRRGLPPVIALTLLAPIILIVSSVGIVNIYNHYVNSLVSPENVSINSPSRGARIYDRNGHLLYEFLDEDKGLRIPVKLDDVSDAFLAATIATEDASFFSNPGVNPRGILRAAWENFSPLTDSPEGEGSGGSGITQQLVKNVYIPPEERAQRSMERKLREAAYAIDLTHDYSKHQILEWYVNEISYGGLYYGVEAASEGYFGHSAKELTLAEAATLAGIPQSPAHYDPLNEPEASVERRGEVLDLLAKQGQVQVDEGRFYAPDLDAVEAARGELLGAVSRTFPLEAPHFVLNHVAPDLAALVGRDAMYHDGLIVTTSIDIDLQTRVQAILEQWIREFEATSNSKNGAVEIIDNHTGEILALIGSRDYYRDDIQGNVDNLIALNSPGSTFKPFIYLASFIKLGWSPNTIIQDTPVTYRESDGTIFQPQNPTKGSYLGAIPIRTALGNSLNVPAFKTALALGVPNVIDVAKQMGFTTLHGQYGPAIATGGVDLNAFDLTYGYSTLANNGMMVGTDAPAPHATGERTIDPVVILKIEDSQGNVLYDINDHRVQRQVVPAEKAYEVTSILSDPANECITFGCGGVAIPGRVAGVKTGTSEPFNPDGPDAGKIGETWAFGYTPDYAVGVWAGNSNNAPVVNIFSTSISFRVMRDAMQATYNGRPSGAFPRPAGVSVPAVQSTTPAGPTATPNPRATPLAGADLPTIARVTPPSLSTSGVVNVQGFASSPNMQYYRLEVGSGLSPSTWTSLGQSTSPVQGGTLGQWQAGSLPDGIYSLRVVVQDARTGTIVSAPVSVTLRH